VPYTAVEILSRCPLFARLPNDDLAALAAVATFRRHPAGSTVFLANERPEGLHVMASGAVKVFVLAPRTGREIVLTTEQPFNTVAELPSFDGGTYPANAEALLDSETLFLERERFEALLRERPVIAVHLLRALGRRLRRLVGMIETISFQEVIHRLARYLAERSRAGLPVELEPNAAIAAQLGTVVELVSRNLARLHQTGVIRLERRSVVWVDEPALLELASGSRH
jgi:CRP-like cAMP-binding protein